MTSQSVKTTGTMCCDSNAYSKVLSMNYGHSRVLSHTSVRIHKMVGCCKLELVHITRNNLHIPVPRPH